MYLKKYSCILLLSIISVILVHSSSFAQKHLGCYAYITEMVKGSNFPMREVLKDKVKLLIDDDQPNMITAQVVYDVTPQPDNPNTSVSVGWIKYDVVNHILWNNSADLNEHPEKLSFDQKYADDFDLCHKK